jgi:hypothetical protein
MSLTFFNYLRILVRRLENHDYMHIGMTLVYLCKKRLQSSCEDLINTRQHLKQYALKKHVKM